MSFWAEEWVCSPRDLMDAQQAPPSPAGPLRGARGGTMGSNGSCPMGVQTPFTGAPITGAGMGPQTHMPPEDSSGESEGLPGS